MLKARFGVPMSVSYPHFRAKSQNRPGPATRKRVRSNLGLLAAMIACGGLSILDAFAQSYPVKPLRIIVGFSAGGATDATARMLAQNLAEELGQPVTVENRTRASGAIATERVATSPPDGYMLLMMTAADTVLPAVRVKLPYNLERDFAAVSLVSTAPFVLVLHPSVPAHNVKELIALSSARSGKLNYGSFGTGSSAHLMAELFNQMAKVQIVHVPYKGAAETSIAVVSGQIDMSFLSVTTAQPFIAAGRLRPLAVTSARRASLMPVLPTLNESGCGVHSRRGRAECEADQSDRIEAGIVQWFLSTPSR